MVSVLTRFSLRNSITQTSTHTGHPWRFRFGPLPQIFLSFFKTLVGKEIAVELKNDVVMTGTLHSVDQYLNIKLLNVKVINPDKYPQLAALQDCFVRGSVVRYIQIPPEYVDTELLQDAARKENAPAGK
jgi:small nuclear ribonucleoprotein (snRNP)-like protein